MSIDLTIEQSLEEELSEAFPSEAEVTEVVQDCYEQLPRDFREQWDVVREIDPRRLAEQVQEDFENEPDARREILIAYIAQKLGYSWFFNMRSSLKTEPLWDLQYRETYERLDASDRHILRMIAGSTRRVRTYIEPKAALAALAIWRHEHGEERKFAELLLHQRSLPIDEQWLYDLIRVLGRRKAEKEMPEGRRLIDLARTQLEAGFADTAALMSGMHFIRLFDNWWLGSARPNLINACDRVAQTAPYKHREWIDLMANAAMAGHLNQTWLERPVQAAIRMSVDDPANEARLRAYDNQCLYEATSRRLEHLYATELRALRDGDARIGAWLMEEVERTAIHNPTRAMRLLELVVAETHPGPGVRSVRLIRALDRADIETFDRLMERLITLYVRCYHLEPYAVRFVRQHVDQVNWPRWPDIEPGDLETYLMVTDYEGAFEGFEVEYEGVRIQHTDKDAAAYVRYFRQKRTYPNTVTGFVQQFSAPPEWIATNIGDSKWVDHLFNMMMHRFDQISRSSVHVPEVMETFDLLGTPLTELESLISRPIPGVQEALRVRRHRPMLLAGLLGAASGALAPYTLGAASVFDAPLVMRLVSDVAARACWFYGFDPAQHPDLPVTILAVALSGSRPSSLDPHDVHRKFHGFLIRKSLIVASIAQGAFGQVLGPTVRSALGALRSPSASPISRERVLSWIDRREKADWKSKALATANDAALPAFEAMLGATLNIAFVYDIAESAEAVLTDRFLKRKYPDWKETW